MNFKNIKRVKSTRKIKYNKERKVIGNIRKRNFVNFNNVFVTKRIWKEGFKYGYFKPNNCDSGTDTLGRVIFLATIILGLCLMKIISWFKDRKRALTE